MADVFAVLITLLPIVFVPWIDLAYEPPKVAGIVFLAIAACFHAGALCLFGKKRMENMRNVFSLVDWTVIAFLAALAVSTVFSEDQLFSFLGSAERRTGFVYYLAVALLYVYIRFVFSKNAWRLLLRATIVTTTLVAVYACAQSMGIDFPSLRQAFPLYGVSGPPRVFATFGHPNLLGAYLAAVFPFLWYVASTDPSRFWRRFGCLALVFSVPAVFLTYSRAAWLALVVAAFAQAFLFFPRFRRMALPIFSIGLFTAILLFAVFSHGLAPSSQYRSPLVYRTLSFADISRGSALARLNEWSFAFPRIAQKPMFGHGLETYVLHSGARKKDAKETAPDYTGADPSIADRIHQLALDTLWSSGLVGLATFLFFFFATFRFAFRRWQGQIKSHPWTATATASVIAYIVVMQFGFDFSLSFLWLLLAAAAMQSPSCFAYEISAREDFVLE